LKVRVPKPDPTEKRQYQEANRQPDKDRTAHDAARGPGKAKAVQRKSLAHLSRRELDDQEFYAAIDELRQSSDREAAIIGGALIDDGLVQAIESNLENTSDTKGLFIDQGAPFATLKAKIVTAFAMGLIDETARDDLERIKDVRNQFSHALRPLSFEHPDISAVCAQLAFYPEVPEFLDGPGFQKPRKRYEIACGGLWVLLMRAANERTQQQVARLKSKTYLANLIIAGASGSGLKGGADDVLRDVKPDKA
jgi:hypothetical protein